MLKVGGKIAFLGIGGAGMAPLAHYFLSRGKNIVGYDRVKSRNVVELEEQGAVVLVEDTLHWSRLFDNVDTVIYTAAFPKNHPVLEQFADKGIVPMKRAKALGLISEMHQCIGVAGTHGKTTTSAILSHILDHASGVLSFVGGRVKNFNGNFRNTGSTYMVAEADEFDRSLLHLDCYGAIVTNLEEDHLDVYNDLEDLVNTVRVFAKDAQIKICHTSVPLSVREGGLVYGEDVSCDYALALHQSVSTGVDVQFKKGGESWLVFNWRLPGKHNALNALAASAMASEVGVEDTVVVEALSSFEGVSRRFEIVYWGKKILVDDYAHHPSEIAKLEEGVNSHFPGKKILTIFQPHLYSRTADFMDGFAQSLSAFSQVWILPIYAAREEPMAGVSSEVLVEKIGPSARMVQKEDLLTSLDQVLAQFDIVLTVGAGDIDAFVPQIKEMLYETD